MNVKFKMPKFGRKLTGGGMAKELLLTTLGTTISIILTFGTAHFIEQREKEQARRMLAMTIINDIDESLKVAKNLLEAEEKGRNISYYLMENIDSLESISKDTLIAFLTYVTTFEFDSKREFKKTNESIFSSSQDSWRTLNDRKFLSNVQVFYNARSLLEQKQKEWIYFQKPVSKEEEYQMIMESFEMSSPEGFIATIRRLLNSTRVKRYVESFGSRKGLYRGFLDLTNLNEENKFLMGITEQDMEDFLNQTYMTVRPVKEKELLGTWNAVMADDKIQIAYEFNKDHTFTTRQVIYWTHSALPGKMIQRFSIEGTWTIEGDSLVKLYDMSSYKLEVDDNEVPHKEKRADIVEQIKTELGSDMMKPAIVRKLEQNNRETQATNLDESGTRLELTEADSSPVHYQRKP